ncbi:unnamed protein product, partial [Ascophyllum nodosum]
MRRRGLTRDGTFEPVSREEILRRERRQGNKPALCSADFEQDWRPYPVNPYSDHYIYTHISQDMFSNFPSFDSKPKKQKKRLVYTGPQETEWKDNAVLLRKPYIITYTTVRIRGHCLRRIGHNPVDLVNCPCHCHWHVPSTLPLPLLPPSCCDCYCR